MQENLLERKILATIITTFTLVIVLSGFMLEIDIGVNPEEADYGMAFVLTTLGVGIYGGLIILVYGNAVSLLIEFVLNRWFKVNTVVFILLHGFFGLVLIYEPILAVYGVTTALFYACMDRWIFYRTRNKKRIRMFLIVPIGIYTVIWAVLTIISPEPPPFTEEDAIAFVSGANTYDDQFPDQPGKVTEGPVTRETHVKEIEDEIYLVTFKETRTNLEDGHWWVSYRVTRNSSSLEDSSH
jgi:hypothetical protein